MRNIQLLPVSDEVKSRLRKFSGMHRMYAQILVDIEAVVGSLVLVSITYAKGDLQEKDLIERGEEMFSGELPEGLTLFWVTWKERPAKVKHVLTSDGQTIFRVDKSPYVVKIVKGDAVHLREGSYGFEVLAGEPTETQLLQVGKWLKSNVIRNTIKAKLPNGKVPSIPKGYRPIEEVLEEIFTTSPVPDKLRKPKSDWNKGRLRETGQIRIVREYTDYEVLVLCRKKT